MIDRERPSLSATARPHAGRSTGDRKGRPNRRTVVWFTVTTVPVKLVRLDPANQLYL